jgi:hypothetical protein
VAKKIRLNAPRLVQVLTPAIQLPPTEAVYLAPVGTDRMALRVSHVARVSRFGQTLRIPPSVKEESFDLWWVPAQGKAVRMLQALPVGDSTVMVRPEESLGLVRVAGANLPAASLVLLTPVGTADFATRAESVQSAPGYGKDMVIAAGQYDLWIEPADGGRSERIAEKVEVTAGKLTVIE